jgi:hypothetical protein
LHKGSAADVIFSGQNLCWLQSQITIEKMFHIGAVGRRLGKSGGGPPQSKTLRAAR